MAKAADDFSCGPSQLGSPCGEAGPATLAVPGAGAGAGNPVHLATGNKHQREIDLPALPGVLGLTWGRQYNAQDPRAGAFGPAWAHVYDTRIVRAGGMLQIVQADGSRIDFRVLPGDAERCASDDPAHGELIRLPGGGYRWRWPDGRTLVFDHGGLLVEICAPTGHRLRIQRGLVPGQPLYGQVLRVVDPAGRMLQVQHDAQGRIQRVSTPAGVLEYAYDDAGRLVDVRFPDGHRREYRYAPGLRAALASLGVRRPDGGRTQLGAWQYDDATRVVASDLGIGARGRLRFQYEEGGHGERITRVSDDAGGRTRFVLAPQGSRYVVVAAEGDGCVGCPPLASGASRGAALPVAGAATLVHDEEGRLLEVQRPSVLAGRSRRLRLVWDTVADGETAVRLPVAIIETGWRPATPAPQRLARAWTLNWIWQAGGFRLAGARAPADAAEADALVGWPAAAPDSAAGWPGLRVERDDFGAVLAWSSAASGRERHELAASGAVLARHFADGRAWTYRRDTQGRLLGLAAEGVQVDVAWQEGQAVEIRQAEERERRQYDAQGRLSVRERRRPADGPERWSAVDRYMHDDQGRLVRHDLAEGGALHYRWRADGRLAAIVWEDADGARREVIDAAPGEAGYRYGNGVRLVPWFRHGRLAGLAHGRVGRRTQRARPVWAQQLVFDAAGRIAGEVLRSHGLPAEHWRYGYDEQGRLARVEGPGVSHGEAGLAWQADGGRAGPGEIRERDASGLPRHVDGWRLQYSGLRRLAQVSRGERVARYRHNAYGERVSATYGNDATAGTWEFVYEGQRLAAVWRGGQGQARPWRRYLHAGAVPVAMIDYTGRAPTLYFLHADAIGLPRAVTDGQGAVRWEGTYSPFGELTGMAGEPRLMPLLRLPGQVVDPLTGWHDNYQRTYEPGRGQYLEPDPFGPPALHAHALPPGVALRTSAFGYAAQQPRRYADPAGLVLLAFDGTSNDALTHANVHQFAELYEGDPQAAPGSAVHYAAGPGGPGPQGAADAAFALTAQRILDAQWAHLIARLQEAAGAQEPTPIDLIGYSRGAALARHFSNMVAGMVRERRFWEWQDGIGAVTGCVDLRFVGLFDSVAQFGLFGSANDLFDFRVSPAWSAVAHAVALHEQRRLFPLLSLADANGVLPLNVVELPFVGAHADIGGGLGWTEADGTERHDLSDVALQWMTDMAARAGVSLRGLSLVQQTVSDPVLHDFRNALERSNQALVDGVWGDAGGAANSALPGLLYPDRAVLAADGSVLAEHQRGHARYGVQERRRTEAFIQRAHAWLSSSDEAAGVVSLPDYAAWLAQR
ncbi:hypothetical protein FOZ76_19040 [Verticiella sediminum]|uniref:DUF2235 domain-containing protein n=1 Tax=Verticiella sediminum TaxID=1247510 RepID=A0A556AEC5_9BURK|nr:DUF2235 domain-containing protein [Verticiella sediminum]TSH91241.1 hypothetical protein FOZ76_19040 [Verticiella sediminum]